MVSQISYEAKRDFEGKLQKLKQDLENAKAEISENETVEMTLTERYQAALALMQAAELGLAAANEKRTTASAQVKDLQSRKSSILTEKEILNKKISGGLWALR